MSLVFKCLVVIFVCLSTPRGFLFAGANECAIDDSLNQNDFKKLLCAFKDKEIKMTPQEYSDFLKKIDVEEGCCRKFTRILRDGSGRIILFLHVGLLLHVAYKVAEQSCGNRCSSDQLLDLSIIYLAALYESLQGGASGLINYLSSWAWRCCFRRKNKQKKE